jgi:hypothetical protein
MHSLDSQYQTQALRAVQTLLQGSGGVFARIPESYSKYLTHEYSDGDISLLGCIHTFEFTEELEDWQVEEAIHQLAKVDPEEWPNPEDIESISLDEVYHRDDEEGLVYDSEDFAEVSEMEYGNKVGRMFKSAIESVFGQEVDSVGDSSGKAPSKAGGFCRQEDKFVGTFEHDKKKFNFELCKDEAGDWHLAYHLEKASRDKLFKPATDTKRKKK